MGRYYIQDWQVLCTPNDSTDYLFMRTPASLRSQTHFPSPTGKTTFYTLEHSTDRQVHSTVTGPAHCRIGEEVTVEVTVFNRRQNVISAEVFLPDSDQYEFVLVHDEYIAHDGKRIQIHVAGGMSRTVYVPVRPYKTGAVTVRSGERQREKVMLGMDRSAV